MRTCALALSVRERNTYILMTSEKIYSNLSSIADEAGTRLSHGGHLAQHGDGAIPRARARFKHLGACVSSEARACGQKRLTRLHGRLQTGACGPAKGCCPIHKCGADAAVMCTPPQPRGNDHGRPVQPPCRHANPHHTRCSHPHPGCETLTVPVVQVQPSWGYPRCRCSKVQAFSGTYGAGTVRYRARQIPPVLGALRYRVP